MSTTEVAAHAIANGNSNLENKAQASAISTWSTSGPAPHPQAAQIIRQIDHYFSDENLRQDAHLLGLFKEGNGTVSLNEVLGFPKMRKFKPKAAVKEAIKESSVVEVVKNVNGKLCLKRRQPLQSAITVIPKINEDRKKIVVLEDKPWLSKGLLRSTGFEPYATDGPIHPTEYEEERSDYDPDNSITHRIETAIRKFTARRKMHQETRAIFDKLLVFGGMDCGSGQFIGSLGDREMEDLSKKEIAERTMYYGVSERVMDGLDEDDGTDEATWVVDFDAIAKAFLSSVFVTSFNWYDEKQVITATMVLRNFYNYLLLHDACKEYNHQITAARDVCDLAEEELLKLSQIDTRFPGGFNTACSTIFEGTYTGLHAASGDWVREDDDPGWSDEQARMIFLAGIFAHGTEEQLKQAEANVRTGAPLKEAFKVICTENFGLEVVDIQLADGEAKNVYENEMFANTYIRPMGKIRCKRWEVPFAKPRDLPESAKTANKDEEFDILLEDETLKLCFPGMKMEACIKELNLGIKFIDYFEAVYVSFFTWLANEEIRDWKEPGPPKEWMVRKNAEREGRIVAMEDSEGFGEDEEDGEQPD